MTQQDNFLRHESEIGKLPCNLKDTMEFEAAAAALGWQKLDRIDPWFKIDEELEVTFYESAYEQGASLSSIPLYRWANPDPDSYASKQEYRYARQEFDGQYQSYLKLLEKVWGKPCRQGRSGLWRKFSHAMWHGVDGLIILAQDDPDVQFGLQLLLWFYPWKEGAPWPKMPLF